MTRILLLTLLVAWPINVMAGLFGPSNYDECILEEMPGARDKREATTISQACRDEHGYRLAKRKNSWFGGMTSNQCLTKYGQQTPSEKGKNLIWQSCGALYPFAK